MRTILLILIISALTAAKSFSAKPIIEVPELPPDEQLEMYTVTDNMFTVKLLEYYEMAAMLYSQLKYYGVEPKTRLIKPTFDDLLELDVPMIKKYYNMARNLEQEIIALGERPHKQQLEELRKSLEQYKKELDNVENELFKSNLKNTNLDFYKKKMRKLVEENENLSFLVDSLQYGYYKKLQAHKDSLRKFNADVLRHSQTIVSFGLSGHKVFINDGRVETDISIGGMITLNAGQFFGFGKYLDIWGEYVAPRIKKRIFVEEIDDHVVEDWNNNFYTVGLAANIPEVFQVSDFYGGLKLGIGYFWADGVPYNSNSRKLTYEGPRLRFEFNIMNYSRLFPMELYFAWSWYSPTEDIVFYESRIPRADLGNIDLTSISLGIRFAIWRTGL